MRKKTSSSLMIAATLAVASCISIPQAMAQGQGCDAISFHDNTATVDCYNLGTDKAVTATLNVDCQPWMLNVKATANIPAGEHATLEAQCRGWGKAVGGSASVS